MTKLIAFPWYGGKFSQLSFILPHLPTDAKHYVEVFGGSAAVLLNRKPAPIETYNDIDGDAVNFFRVLRDRTDELVRVISLTPYSREELRIACSKEPDIDDLERARRFYVRARQARAGLAQTCTVSQWKYSVTTSSLGMAQSTSAFRQSLFSLFDVAERLRRVQIENNQFKKIVNTFDSDDTVFYLDPPYVLSSRVSGNTYAFEMADEDHAELADMLCSIRGRAVISGYRCDLYDRLYRDWIRIDGPIKPSWASINKSKRRESIWMNFEPAASRQAKQLTMFA